MDSRSGSKMGVLEGGCMAGESWSRGLCGLEAGKPTSEEEEGRHALGPQEKELRGDYGEHVVSMRSMTEREKEANAERCLNRPEYLKIYKKSKSLKNFRRLFLAQELRMPSEQTELPAPLGSRARWSPGRGQRSASEEQSKPVWVIKFSKDGKYLAAGGKGKYLCIWKVISSPMERWGVDQGRPNDDKTIATLNNWLVKHGRRASPQSEAPHPMGGAINKELLQEHEFYASVFDPTPVRIFQEHTLDVLDCDWSKNGFLLTASMDRTVKLWHHGRKPSLKTFLHPDFVTCVKFHPHDDRFFVSGCLDHSLRVWSILDNEVVYSYNCGDLITALDLSQDGKYTVFGTFNGNVHVLHTKELKLAHSFNLLEKLGEVTRKPHKGPKVTGLEFFLSPRTAALMLVVTSNDSRIRIYDLDKMQLVEKLRGFDNKSSQICAHFMPFAEGDSPVVLSASENHWIYAWILMGDEATQDGDGTGAHPTGAQNKGHFKGHVSLKSLFKRSASPTSNTPNSGAIFHNQLKPLHHKDHYIKNSDYITFHAHNHPITAAVFAPYETLQVLSLSNDSIYETTLNFCDDPTPHTRRGPMLKEFGKIIVSADTAGNIRVFRNDIPNTIRERVLKIFNRNEPQKPLETVLHSLTHPKSATLDAARPRNTRHRRKSSSSSNDSLPPGFMMRVQSDHSLGSLPCSSAKS